MIKRNVGRYYKLSWGGGQITIPKDMAKEIEFKNKDKTMIEYDEQKNELRIRIL